MVLCAGFWLGLLGQIHPSVTRSTLLELYTSVVYTATQSAAAQRSTWAEVSVNVQKALSTSGITFQKQTCQLGFFCLCKKTTAACQYP